MRRSKEEELARHRKALLVLGFLGMPFCVAFGLGSAAHFRGNALLPALEDPETAFSVLVLGACGAFLAIAIASYHAIKVKALEDELT